MLKGGLGVAVGFVLGLLGGGGSILALPIFLEVFHEPSATAIAESLLVVAVGAGVGLGRRGEAEVVQTDGVALEPLAVVVERRDGEGGDAAAVCAGVPVEGRVEAAVGEAG